MKNIFNVKITLLSCILAVCLITAAHAQVTGPKSIPGDYANLATAITDLNTNGVGAGGATINIAGGYTETAPAGGFVLGSATLNGSLSVSNLLVFQKSGGGANPLLTAFTPGTTTNSDGIFKINGADFVTIDGIDLIENGSNTTPAMQMEWGYSLVRVSGTDGSQDNTIKNCTITLSKANFGTPGTDGSHGIFSGSVTATNTPVTVTAITGANSRNHFYTNTISDCNIGIYCAGFNDASPYALFDQGNYMGLGVGTGNQITNFGSSATSTAIYGIYLIYQNNSNANYNTVNNATGGSGVVTSGNVIGIFHDATINTNFAASFNNVTVTSARTTGTAGATIAIGSLCNPATSTTGSITINNNVVRAVIVNTLSLASNHIHLISTNALQLSSSAVNSVVTINNNELTNTIGNSTAANFNLIDANDLSTDKTINGNFTSGTIGRTVNSTSNLRGITATVAGVTTGTHTISGNNISNISIVSTSSVGALLGISAQSGSTSLTNNGPDIIVTNNTLTNLSSSGGTPVSGVSMGLVQVLAAINGRNNIVSGNTISNCTSAAGGVSCMIGGASSTLSQQIFGNTISGCTSSLGGLISAVGITNNVAVTSNIHNNKIYDISVNPGIVGGAAGIFSNNASIATSTTNIYNNIIGRIYAPAANFANSVTGISQSFSNVATTNVINAYYNTVYLDGSSVGGTACYYAVNGNGTVTLRNNLFVNNSTAGQVNAFRYFAGVFTNYGALSNNNILYSSTGFVFSSSTLQYNFAGFQALVTPRDGSSKNENTPFLNTGTGSLATYLHINPAIATQAESGAANIATFTNDFDGVIRQGNPGYTGAGLCAPDIGADEGDFTAASFCFDASLTNIYTLGNIPVGYGSPHIIKARIVNVGTTTMTSFSVNLTVSGSNTFSDVQNIASLAPGASSIVSFAGFSPANTGSNTINVTVSGGSDQNGANNSLTIPQTVSTNLFSYKQPGAVATGSIGVGQDGNFVAKFTTSDNFGNSDTINELKVDFSNDGAGNPYEYRIWDATGPGGTPGTLLFSSTQQAVVAGQAFLPVNPPVAVSGDFYVGVHEIAGNVGFQYQAESPLRTGIFYYNLTSNPTVWNDIAFSGAPTARFWIEAQLVTPVPPNCAINMQPPASGTGICLNQLLTWASGGGGPTGYRITFGTNSPNYDNIENNTDLGLVTTYTPVGGMLANITYGWKIVPYNGVGPSIGCGIQTFTTAATTALNEDFTNVTFPPGCWTRQTADWARNAVSANGVGTGSAWFDFYNVNPVTVPQSDLTTPVFTAAPFNYAVTFNHAYAPYDDFASGDYIDTLEILASTNGGSSYTTVAILEGGLTGDLNTAPATDLEFVPTAGQWGTKTIPIPTGTNRIIFRAISNFGNDLFLDNITLVALPNCVQSPIAPVNASSMCPSASTLLSWSAFPGATGYNVYLDASLVSTNQAGTTYTTGALSVGPHTWSVIPQLISGTEPSCSNWSFTVNAPPTPDASSNSPVCVGFPLNLFGDNTAIGQTSGNTWSWSGPSFSSSFQNATVNASATLANSGTYTLTVTNLNGCTATTTTTLVVNPNPVLSIGSQINVSCNGLSDGSVDLDATNGTAPYLFDLIGPSTPDGIFTGLAAGPYTATVNDDNGCAATSLIVTITEPPVLTVSAGSNTPVCSGTSLNLTSSPVGGTAGYSYAWTGPNGPVPAVQNPTIASATTADGGQYDVLVTDANGCTSTGSHTVLVNASPTAAIALSGSGDKCLGQSATVSLTFTGTGPWNYTITGNGGPYSGSTSSNPASVNVTPIAAGVHNYTVTAIGNASCPTGGTTSGSATVNVSTAPPPSSGPVPAGAAEACAGSVMLITSNVISGQNIIYSWNTGSNSSTVLFSTNIGGPFTAGPFQTNTNQVYAQFGALGGGQSGYQVCLQGVNGCGSSINKCLWIRGVVSGPGAITPANGVVACENTTLPYSCGASSGASVYNWTLGGSATPITLGQGTQNVQVTFPSGFTSAQLCVTAALACGGSSTSAPRCISISSNPANPNVPTGAATACPGATGVSYSIPAVPGATGYNWTVPANATIATGTNSPSITVNFPTPYNGTSSVCVTTTSACGTSAVKCKNVASGIPNQPAGITGPLTNVCGSTVQYSVVSPIASSYTWTTPAGTTISGSATGSTILLNVSPTFTSGVLTVAANSVACAPATSAPRTSSTIWGRPNNPGTITQNPPGAFCSGAALNFSVVNPLVGPTPVYTWTSSNGTITSLQGPNNIDVTWGTNAAGTITVKAVNGCGQSAGVSSQVFTPNNCREEGIGSTSAADFSVYPNPTVGKTTVSFYSEISFNYTLKVIDYLGREVFSNELKAIVGDNTQEVDMSHLAKGMYLIEVAGTDHTQKVKVIVQ